MVKELRFWLKDNSENVVVNDAGRKLNLSRYYEEYGIQRIWVAVDESETEIDSVAVELPEDRAKLINFLLNEVSGLEARYAEDKDLLHIHFDGC